MRRFVHKSLPTLVAASSIMAVLATPAFAATPKYAQGVATWVPAPGAVNYNVYFKEAKSPVWQNAVNNAANNVFSWKLTFLKRGVKYVYQVSAEDGTGKEYWWSKLMTLKTSAMK